MCERELCVFAFQTLGVMNEAADEIATGAQVKSNICIDLRYIYTQLHVMFASCIYSQLS